MWAQQLIRPGVLQEVEVPPPDGDTLSQQETLLRVEAAAICGSDLPYFRDDLLPAHPPAAQGTPPGFPLHEVVGEVVASHDPELPIGARAVGWATPSTAMAEYTVTRSDGLWAIADDQAAAVALTLQPLACVTDAARCLGDLSGLRVAVLGLGPFGVLFCHVAKSLGARVVTGVDPVDRSDVAQTFLIDEVVPQTSDRWARSLLDDARPDVVIEAVGHQTTTLSDAVEALAIGGRLFYFGVPDQSYYPFPMATFFRKHLTAVGGTVQKRRDALARADAYLQQFPTLSADLVTHTFEANQAQSAFETASVPAAGRLKVQLTMTSLPET